MGTILTSEGGWLGPLVKLFGFLMNGIYVVLDKFGIGNIGLAIIIFTIITRIILHPFTLQQQKSSKLMSIIQPEIQAIQKKYEGRRDQQSLMQQQEEIKGVYEKYGTSMTGSCLQLAIQMPIIFALYRVIMNIPAYVGNIKGHFSDIVTAMAAEKGGVTALCESLKSFATNEANAKSMSVILKQVQNFGLDKNVTEVAQQNFIIDFLYKLNPQQITALAQNFGEKVQEVINTQMGTINELNGFCGMNLATAPKANGFSLTMLTQSGNKIFNVYLLIPILAFLTQYLSSKLMQSLQEKKKTIGSNDEDNPMQSSMKTMMITMPLVSAVFTWGFASGLGLYWIVSAGVLCIQQLIINKQISCMDMDEVIRQNIEKANKKREKKGLPLLNTNVTVNSIMKKAEEEEAKAKLRENIVKSQTNKMKESQDFYFGDEADPNSLFAKANMVKKYNEKYGNK